MEHGVDVGQQDGALARLGEHQGHAATLGGGSRPDHPGFDPATRPGVEFPGCLGEGAHTYDWDSVIDWAGQFPLRRAHDPERGVRRLRSAGPTDNAPPAETD